MAAGGFGYQNFQTLQNSFFMNFLVSSMISINSITTELNLTGGNIYSTLYLLTQVILFGFTVKSFFVSILYDIVVNKEAADNSQNEAVKTGTPKVIRQSSTVRKPITFLDSELSAKASLVSQAKSNNSSLSLEQQPRPLRSPVKKGFVFSNFVTRASKLRVTSDHLERKQVLVRQALVLPLSPRRHLA